MISGSLRVIDVGGEGCGHACGVTQGASWQRAGAAECGRFACVFKLVVRDLREWCLRLAGGSAGRGQVSICIESR
jgi:hypothetical protein